MRYFNRIFPSISHRKRYCRWIYYELENIREELAEIRADLADYSEKMEKK